MNKKATGNTKQLQIDDNGIGTVIYVFMYIHVYRIPKYLSY